MPLGDFVQPRTIPKPLKIGRAGRLLFGVRAIAYFAWLMSDRLLLWLDRPGVLVGCAADGTWLRVQWVAPRCGADTGTASHGAALKGFIGPSGRVGKKQVQIKMIRVDWKLIEGKPTQDKTETAVREDWHGKRS